MSFALTTFVHSVFGPMDAPKSRKRLREFPAFQDRTSLEATTFCLFVLIFRTPVAVGCQALIVRTSVIIAVATIAVFVVVILIVPTVAV